MIARDLISQYFLIPVGKTYSKRNYLNAKAYQKYVEKLQYRPIDELQFNQDTLLRKMIEHAYKNVPYYKELFDKIKLSPSDIKTKNDLKNIPFLTKDILTRSMKRLIAVNIDRTSLKLVSTGGTTGTPINFYRDQNSEYKIDGSNWRFFNFCGYKPGVKLAVLWGNENDLLNSMNLHGRLKAIMDNVLVLNFYDLSEQKLQSYTEIVKKKKPQYFKGFSSAMYIFMRYLKRHNIDIPLPKAVIITSDKIDNLQKKELDNFFHNRVFNEYGCREFSIIGFECEEHSGIHIGMENMVLEIEPNAAENGYGEVIITSLTNWGMPFIRFKLGDSSKLLASSCKCGRNLPLLESIRGRKADFVVTRSEKLIYGDFFAHLFYGSEGIEHFQIIQKEIGKVIIYIEKNEFFSDKETELILDQLKEMTGEDLKATICIIRKIDKHRSGKRRSVISEVAKDYI